MRRGAAVVLGALLLVAALATACERENWGGPKGPPIASASAAPPWTPPGFDASAPSSAPTLADAGRPLFDTGRSSLTGPLVLDAGAGTPLVVHVESDLTGGKLPGWEHTVAALRPALRACAEGKGEADAMVEITAHVGPKGRVTGTDKTGGSQFAQGVVPCIVHVIEEASFGKPASGTPHLTVRVRLRRD